MSRRPPNEILAGLASQLVDGGLDDAQYAQLCDLVAADPAAAAWLAEWMEQHVMLEMDMGTLDHGALAARPLLGMASGIEACGPDLICDVAESRRPRGSSIPDSRGQVRLWYGLSVIAASLLVVVGYGWGWNAGNEASRLTTSGRIQGTEPAAYLAAVATIAGGVDAQFDEGVKLGSRLSPGRLRLNRGIAQIAFDRGATVVLQGPAELEIVDAATCQLVSGSLSADVLPEASGFSIAAGGVKVAERDARFGLKTSPDTFTEVHAFGGELNLIDYRHPKDQQRRLAEGEALRWHAGENAEGIAPDPTAFVTNDKFQEAQLVQEQQSYERWLAYSQRWMNDPNVLLRYEFGEAVDQSIVNTVNPASHGAKSQQKTARMVRGRWNGKSAMLFDGQTDLLTVEDAPELQINGDLSVAVWLRTRSYPSQGFTRIVGKGQGCDRNYGLWMDYNGDLLWQVCPDKDPERQEQWDRCSLRTRPLPVGQWALVTGVAEGKRLKIYINDELQVSVIAPTDFALTNHPLTIGYYGDVPAHDQYFCGDIDELILLDRALAEEEIKEMYEAGNPASISEGLESPNRTSKDQPVPRWNA
ncbi:LamG domain-containing protein [Aeoliella sp. SH292]|uniref:LamG domain-containing protein n=1 Tax=Aeoliella sp. SH292 TaxID=3454464 RepID=UPI003F96CE72